MNKSIKIIIVTVIIIISIVIINKLKTNKIEYTKNATKSNTIVDYKIDDNGGYTVYDTKTNQVIDKVQSSGEVKLYQDDPNYSDFAPKDLEEPLENNENLEELQ